MEQYKKFLMKWQMNIIILEVMKVELELGPQNKVLLLNNRDELLSSIEEYKKKYNNKNEVPRPEHWSGWNLIPTSIEFWLDGDSRIHERLKYIKDNEGNLENLY